jgi:hypothetical protein
VAINLGVTAGLAKEADDALQIIFEAIASTAADAATAGSAHMMAPALPPFMWPRATAGKWCCPDLQRSVLGSTGHYR